MVEHDHRFAARLEDAMDFVDGALRVDGVVEDAVRIDRVERAIGEGLPFGVALEDAAGQLANLEMTPRQADGLRREIDAGDAGAGAGELDQVDARAAADLQHALPAPEGDVTTSRRYGIFS